MRIKTESNKLAVAALKGSRKRLGLTQKALAGITGLSVQMIADYETYRARVPAGLILQVQQLEKMRETEKVAA